jgi:glutamyl/glutaminyl-tRNA synthetase
MGYLPEAFINFLVLLGWSPGNDVEILSLQGMIEKFTLDRVNASPARFLREKLDWMNGQYIRSKPLGDLVEAALPFLQAKYPMEGVPRETLEGAVRQQQERLKRLDEISDRCAFVFAPQIEYDPKAVEKVLKKPSAAAGLRAAREVLTDADWASDKGLEGALRAAATRLGCEFQEVAQPVRVALTGRTFSPPIHETLLLLGRDRSLSRIDTTLKLYCS